MSGKDDESRTLIREYKDVDIYVNSKGQFSATIGGRTIRSGTIGRIIKAIDESSGGDEMIAITTFSDISHPEKIRGVVTSDRNDRRVRNVETGEFQPITGKYYKFDPEAFEELKQIWNEYRAIVKRYDDILDRLERII